MILQKSFYADLLLKKHLLLLEMSKTVFFCGNWYIFRVLSKLQSLLNIVIVYTFIF